MGPPVRTDEGLTSDHMCEAHFQQHVNKALSQLWRSQQLCDVHLKACDSGEHLPAHRIMLASSSGFFRAMFCGAGQVMKEGTAVSSNSNMVVQLPYSKQQVMDLLTMLYDYSIQVGANNVAWMLDMSSYLEIQPLQEACCGFLRSALSPETCIDVLLLSHHYHCSSLQTEAVRYLAEHLASLLLLPEVRQGMCRLPAPVLQELLSAEVLEVEQEGELLCLVSDWVSAAPQDRLQHLPQLLSLLQLPVLPQEPPLSQQQLTACTSPAAAQLASQLHSAAIQCQQQQQQGQLVSRAQLPHQQQQQYAAVAPCSSRGSQLHLSWPDPNNFAASSSSHSSTSKTPCPVSTSSSSSSVWQHEWLYGAESLKGIGAVVVDAWPGRQRGYQATRLLIAGGHDLSWRGLKTTEMYDPRSDTWCCGPSLPAALPFAGAGLLGLGQLYVVGGGMYSSQLARLDVDDGCWHNLEGPKTPRLHAAVTGASGLLYVAGGRSQVNQVVAAVEVYDPETACWRSLPDMQQPRYAHALVPLAGYVYAVGGQASKTLHKTIEVFHPERSSWDTLPQQLHTERKYCAAAALAGRLMVLGGMNEARNRLRHVEGYDPREGRWTCLTGMQHARSSCGVAVLGGRLYAVGGNAGDEQLHTTVEEYDPAAGKWRSCAALSCGRSGLLAAAI